MARFYINSSSGAVEYNGGYAALFTDFTEHLQLP